MSSGPGKDGSRLPVISEYAGARSVRAAARRRMRSFIVTGAVVLLLGAGVALLTGALRLPIGRSQPAENTATVPAASAATATAAGSAPISATATPTAGGSANASDTAASTDTAWMDKYRGKIVDGFKTERGYKAVALTFDDGPNGETQHVIDALAKVDGHGTFFFTGRKLKMGWAKTQPSIISKGGFELANHTQHHTLPDGVSSMWRRSYKTDLAEINGPDDIIKRYGGQRTVWLRPMGGMIDKTGVKAAVDTDHLVVNWTVDSNDSHDGPHTSDYIYKQCTENIKSGDVVLLHVTHPESMKALARIVATLDKRGFKLVTLTELAQHSTGPITEHVPK